MILLLALLIPLLSFCLQSYPRLFNKFFGVDVWTRMLEIEHVRKAKHKIPGKIKKGFIIDGYFDYPIIFPWIFSFFNKKTIMNIQGFVSPFFDSLQNLLVFFIAYQFSQNLYFALVAQAIYSLTPVIAIENSYMTPRSFGYLNFTLAFLPIFLYHTDPNLIYLLTSLVFTTTLFLSHRFALQSLLFISIFFSLYDKSLLYLGIFLAGLVCAIVLTKGYYLRVAKGHLSNIYFWVLNYNHRFAHQIYGNQKKGQLDWVGRIYHLMSIFSPIFLFSLNVWSVSGFIFLGLTQYYTVLLPDTLITRMSVWIIFFYIFGAIVLKVKWLIPIGEGQRYLEMATVPSAIVTTYIAFSLFNQLGIIAFIGLVILMAGNLTLIIYIQVKGIISDKNRTLTTELQNMYKFINKLPGTPRIMCIPHQITTMTTYNTKADILVNADNPGLMKITEFYPVLTTSLDKLKLKYKLDYVLLRNTFAKKSSLKLKKAKVVHKVGDIELLEV